MAPKKKPQKADGEVDLFEEFKKKLKKNEQEFETPKIPAVQEIFKRMDELGECKSWCFDSEFDPMAFRILWHSLEQVHYNEIAAIRVWKCNGGDESVRSICYYLDSEPKPPVQDLQFVDNGLTALGCEMLARTFGPQGNKDINFLRLDFNPFGTPGIEKLSWGLSQNERLRYLSLQYCNIGEDGGQFLTHILMYYRSAIEVLKLRGNYLGNRGVVDVLNGAKRSKSLTDIDLYDNKFADTPEVVSVLKDLFSSNLTLVRYDLSGNLISDAGAQALVQSMIPLNHLDKVFVTEQVSSKTWEALDEITSGKGKKGKKKK
mmetsp:Transcript_97927/g.204269  ORF Transcript_97927/g.204269 Transcript_97927/m.204269 type:complete len:317 (-) Transcript_97927:260-1210(-)|eukprot:CAMPEP_0206594046 /NCGR_PEP_ID=MMETSP0325_2-20121206/42099_1 /ASSEMBLY_ACC=CAM_ASM_000347 /TAXON_ID=2866 /ORGANISM="Crypthecodinium cohnii, Strain Seligo" /LENGTH=316 /DNA_ID=CAMNT_0054104349 /DNA_START=54 /DNA_END=1004 /DNA_ORIENTATION=+